MQELENSLASDAPAYIEFLYRYDPKKQQIFAFYEGDEDASYYGNILRTQYGKNLEIEEIIAGCKHNVLKLLREFNWGIYRREQIGFFVDKDLFFWLGQDYPQENNLFVTDGYSVENYMVSKDMFHILLTQIMGFGRATKAELNLIENQFTVLLKQFQEKMMRIMAICILAKKKDEKISINSYSLYNALKFELCTGEITFNLSYDELLKVKTMWQIDDDQSIKELISLFKNRPQEYHIRGKWLIHFMISCGDFMRLHYHRFCPSLKVKAEKRLRPICEIQPTKAVAILGPRCHDIPPSLKQFMKNNYGEYLKQVNSLAS